MECKFCKKQLKSEKNYCDSNCWNKDHKDRMKLAKRKYYENNRLKVAKLRRLWMLNNPEKRIGIKRRQHLKDMRNNTVKWKARRYDYKKRNKLCEICSSKENLEFHHEDYHQGIGKTLCLNCHRKMHQSPKSILILGGVTG